jgi:hypothetical protein
VPTFDVDARFRREFSRLTPENQRRFRLALHRFVEDLRRGRFRKGLRVKRVQGTEAQWEMTWAPNGRALFTYGPEVHPGEQHVIWQRIGGHEVFE